MRLIILNSGLYRRINLSKLNQILIANALFSKTRQKVLAILYGNPKESFYLNEIARKARVGKGSVVRELRNLTDAGLISSCSRGNQTHFQANSKNPVFPELNRLVYKILATENLIIRALAPVREELIQAFLYGPYVASNTRSYRDISILLVSDRLSEARIRDLLFEVEEVIDRKIQIKLISKQEYGERITRKQSFIYQLMHQPKIWLLENSGSPRVSDIIGVKS